MIRTTLDRVRAANPNWVPGDSLSQLVVEEGLLAELGRLLRDGIEGGVLRSTSKRAEDFGAALMLFGSRVFGRQTEHFTYEVVGQAMGVVGFAEKLTGASRNNMQEGLWRRFGLRVLHGDQGRRFRATMLFHSGGTWSLLVAALRALGQRFGVECLRRESTSSLIDLLADLATGSALSGSHRIALGSDEARVAIAEQMTRAFEAREALVQDGHLRPTARATLDAAIAGDHNLKVDLAAPDDAAVLDLLESLFSFESGGSGPAPGLLDWSLVIRSGQLPHLAVGVPERLRLDGIPSDVERVRLVVVGAEEDAARRPILRRSGHFFQHFQGSRTLRIPRSARLPILVRAEYRRGAEVREVEAASLTLPEDEVVLFDVATGQPCRRAFAGASVGVVCPPGCHISDLSGFQKVAANPGVSGEIWTGDVPPEPLYYVLETPEGQQNRVLAASGGGVTLHVRGEETPGLKLGRARCYSGWPRIHVGSGGGTTFRVEGPQGPVSVGRRRNELQPPQPLCPGRYRITVDQKQTQTAKSIVVLPRQTDFSVTSDRDGTHILAKVGEEPLELRCRTTGDSGSGAIDFDPEVRGTLDVVVTVPLGASSGKQLHLDWQVTAVSPRVTILTERGGAPTESTDLALLRGNGGIFVQGAPRVEMVVDVEGYRYRQRLDPNGERFFPFSALPPQALSVGGERVRTRVELGGRTYDFTFVDATALRPTIATSNQSPEGTRVSIRVKREFSGDVQLEAVPAWKPWSDSWPAPAELVRTDGEALCYSAMLDTAPGPYMVTLTCGGTRVVGMGLVWRGEPTSPPESLPALERSLWVEKEADGERLDDLLRERLRHEDPEQFLAGLFANFIRYGARWFRIGKAVVDAASQYALQAQLGLLGDDMSGRLLEVFRDRDAPHAAVRHSDFEWVAETHEPSSDVLLAWLERLRALSSGLVLPAWRAWESRVPGDKLGMFMGVLGGLAELQQNLKPLSQEQMDLVQTPPLEHLGLDETAGLRARALVEVRRAEPRLREAGGRRADHLQRLLRESREATSERVPALTAVLGQKGLPEFVVNVEQTVRTACTRVERWRKGEQNTNARWADARLLAEEFPLLFDYWLHRLTAEQSEGDNEKR